MVVAEQRTTRRYRQEAHNCGLVINVLEVGVDDLMPISESKMHTIKRATSYYLLMIASGIVHGSILDRQSVSRDRHNRIYSKNDMTLDDSNERGRYYVSSLHDKRIGSMHLDFGNGQNSSSQRWTDKQNNDEVKYNRLIGGDHDHLNTYRTTDIPQADPGAISLNIDASALVRLLSILGTSVTCFTAVFMGTLRLLAPMIFARRLLVLIGNIIRDYMTGRYVRKTYTRIERTYLLYYEAPAVFRAFCRITGQISIYFILSSAMAWLVGISHPPCRSDSRSLASFCALLWTSAVVGTGHALSTAMSIWGGPIRLQAKFRPSRSRSTWNSFILRPWRVIHWMKNPEAFLSMMATPEVKPFDPKPEIFPSTWISLRFLQIFAVSKVVSTQLNNCDWCSNQSNNISNLMRSYFVQLALCDEWYRVFIIEKRVGLGIAVVTVYLIAMIVLLTLSVRLNPSMTILMIPSFLALVTSGWMNVAIFWSHAGMQRSNDKGYTNYFGKF